MRLPPAAQTPYSVEADKVSPNRTEDAALTNLLSLPHLLKEQATADVLDVEVSTLRRWRWSGVGPPFIKVQAAVRYDPRDLAKFIEAGRRRSTSHKGDPR